MLLAQEGYRKIKIFFSQLVKFKLLKIEAMPYKN